MMTIDTQRLCSSSCFIFSFNYCITHISPQDTEEENSEAVADPSLSSWPQETISKFLNNYPLLFPLRFGPSIMNRLNMIIQRNLRAIHLPTPLIWTRKLLLYLTSQPPLLFFHPRFHLKIKINILLHQPTITSNLLSFGVSSFLN